MLRIFETRIDRRVCFFFFQAEDGIRDLIVTGVQTCALPIYILAQNTPWLIGGAADLAPSTKTRLTFEGAGDFTAAHPEGRNFHFGIREHAMCSILNGLSLSKVRAYGTGFQIFSDYMRPALLLSALMELPV